MRSILSIIALFSCCTLAAQEYIPTYGRELPRGEVIAYPTAQEAAAASAGDTRYFTRLADWTQKDNVFSTEFTVPFAWTNRQVFFHLGWASADYEVRVNGKTVAYDSDCSTPAEFNLTRHAQEGRNTLEIVVSAPVAGGASRKLEKRSGPGNRSRMGHEPAHAARTRRTDQIVAQQRGERQGHG